MYLARLSQKKIGDIKAFISSNPEAIRIRKRLDEGAYDIYFSFDSSSRTLIYEALAKEKSDDPYLYLKVGGDRYLRPDYGRDMRGAYALADFIFEAEKDRDIDELVEAYSPYGDFLRNDSLYSEEEAKYRKENASVLDSLKNVLLQAASSSGEKTYQKANLSFEIGIKNYYGARFAVCIMVNAPSKAIVYDIPSLYKATYQETSIPLRTKQKSVLLAPSSFTEREKKALEVIGRERSSYYAYNERNSYLKDNDIVLLLEALKGSYITFEDETVLIDEDEIEATCRLNEDCTFSFDPPLEEKIYKGESKGFVYKKKEKRIQIVSFTNPSVKAIYDFSDKNPDFRYDLFKREMGEEIAPLLDGAVEVDEKIAKQGEQKKPRIIYNVAYHEDEGILEFATHYHFADREVEQASFLLSPLAAAKFSSFQNELSTLGLPLNGMMSTDSEIRMFLRTDLINLNSLAEVYLSENLVGKTISRLGAIRFSVETGIDWFSLNLESDSFTDEELEKIIKAFRKKRKFVRLRNSFIDLEDEDDEGLNALKMAAEDFSFSKKAETKQLPLYQAFKLTAYSKGDLVHGDKLFDLLSSIKDYKNEKISIPKAMENDIRPYQVEGVKWLSVLAKNNLGGILADDMGLGKTLETIGALSQYGGDKPTLIVCPKSLLYNWEAEFKRWNPKFKTHIIEGGKESRLQSFKKGQSGRDVYLISYETLRNDIDDIKGKEFGYVILDEGQNIANAYAKKSQAVKQISSEHRLVLTGTPIQNSLMDLWSIFDFLMPGYLPDQRSFYAEYVHIQENSEKMRERLLKKVQPFILRRKKEDVLSDLPPKSEQIFPLSMAEEEKTLYLAYLARIKKSLKEEQKKEQSTGRKGNTVQILSELTRLRQLCVDPSMFLEDVSFLSSKLSFALEYINASLLSGHKVIVFSSFVKSLEHLGELLRGNHISFETITGKTPASSRIAMANRFNTTNEVQVMLVSLKAGGTGLNLIGGDIVIHLDPWWNYAAESQASDRAHRIGQVRPVSILKLIIKDSVEERVLSLQESKRDLSDKFGSEDAASLSLEDIAFILS